jgi:hypothetical protein
VVQSLQSSFRRRLSAAVRGLRRSLERDRLLANLKTLLAVAPLTVLIWIYAEQQQLVTEKDVPVRLSVVSSDPAHQVVTLLSPSDGTVRVSLQGSQVGIDRAKPALEQTFLASPLTVTVGSLAPGRQTLVTLDQVESSHVFYSHGVAVTGCSPETLEVRVDTLEERQATVQAPADAPGLVKAVFDPPTVILRGPAQALDALRQSGHLAAIADLTADPALQQPGLHGKVPVHLLTPANVTVIPDTVNCDLTVGQADQTVAVSPVPVKVQATKWLVDTYKFDFTDALTAPVTLIGPPLQIALIDPHHPPIIAVVNLDNNDALYHGSKPVTFQDTGLPAGVRVKSDNPPPMVQISVDPR